MRTWDIRFNTHVHVGLCNTDPEPACLPSFVPDVFNSIPVRIKKKKSGAQPASWEKWVPTLIWVETSGHSCITLLLLRT